MAIPKYNEMYKEFLQCISDGAPHKNSEIRERVFEMKGLTESDRQVYISNGTQRLCDNRIGWTRTYLKKAGLIATVQSGYVALTEEGKKVVRNMPERLDNDFFMQYESFREFRNHDVITPAQTENATEDNATPQDVLDRAHREISDALADELLAEIMRNTPEFFERLVVMLLQKMGYGGNAEDSGEVVGRVGDEGIDGIIKEDKLGFNLIYIQAKRWDLNQTIGRPEIQKFVGALAGQGATKGLFITTAKFTQQAQEYAKKQHTTKIILVDGEALAKLMMDYDLGVSVVSTYQIKKIDSDFFDSSI